MKNYTSEISQLVIKLDKGEDWKTFRGEAVNLLDSILRDYRNLKREEENLRWKLDNIREQIQQLKES